MKIGLIFDLDGTLWDATENITECWNQVLNNKEIDIHLDVETVTKEMGKTMEDIADSLFASVPENERYKLLQDCLDYENDYLAIHGGNLYENVRETLELLKENYSLYFVSNGQKDYIKTFSEFYGFDKLIEDYEEAGRTGKPKDYNIKLVSERNSLDKTFYIGDTLGDMEATDKAGATFIHAAYGFGSVPADRYKISDIAELPVLLKKII